MLISEIRKLTLIELSTILTTINKKISLKKKIRIILN